MRSGSSIQQQWLPPLRVLTFYNERGVLPLCQRHIGDALLTLRSLRGLYMLAMGVLTTMQSFCAKEYQKILWLRRKRAVIPPLKGWA